MKPYLVHWESNYGLCCFVVNAITADHALEIAAKAGAWDGAEAIEIDVTKPGIVASAYTKRG